ncbi:MAG TPA: hypothetical protein VEY30_02560, partial [Myxococcaceae bacterium]|nr:hypothetical protein [Myxococcaceae bacterium]
PGYYERLCHGKDASWVSEYVDGEYPRSDKGSIYGEWLDKLEARGGIAAFKHPSDGVFLNLDLGVSDATALWWWRLNDAGVPDLIDYYEATGKGASHFFEVIANRGWKTRKIFLPHDARARTFQTGISTLEQWVNHFGPEVVEIGPELSVDDGIAAARWLLEQPVRFHTRCEQGLRMLRAYRYVWDEVHKIFAKKPSHDLTSHGADAFRYVACVVKVTEALMRKPEPPSTWLDAPPTNQLDELWELNEQQRSVGTERI